MTAHLPFTALLLRYFSTSFGAAPGKLLLSIIGILACGTHLLLAADNEKLRVVVTTDFPPIGVVKGGDVPNDQKSDPDDMQSIVRYLLYSNEFDTEALIVSSGTFANKAEKKHMLDVIDRYAKVYDSLKTHDSRYPTPDELRSVTYEGRSGTWGKKGTVNIGEGKDSEASKALIAIVDKPDPRPVYVGIWGDCSVVAQAVWKVQNTRSAGELDKFLSKLRLHQIATQDGTIAWLRDNFPKLFIIHSAKTYQGMFGGNDPESDLDWVNTHIRKDHGALCEIYPHEGMGCTGVCEGDSPAFLWLVSANRGLNDPDDPTQESWGGQFKKDGDKNHYIDGPGPTSISKWRKAYQLEFQERADWCVNPYRYKPRIIHTTDLGADPDDEQSMVRQLVSANEFELEGLIVATGCWKKSQSSTAMLDKLVDGYGKVVKNLSVHAEGFPSYEYLKSISVMGQKDYGMSDVGEGKDSPGSDLIIASVDKEDPRPVWVTGWGGMNTIAQAIWKAHATRTPEEFKKFLSKLRCFDILGQDDAGAWIAKNFPDLFYIRATGVYGWAPSDQYLDDHIQNHGPLGALYPDRKWATEGDTPAFMHMYPNCLNDPEQIDQGGWGGRFSFTKQAGIRSMSEVAKINKQGEPQFDPYLMYGNTPEKAKAIKRWNKGYNNNFAARMDWSITGKYEEANHHPIAIVDGDKTRKVLKKSVVPGSSIELSAAGSSDPDGNGLTYSWSFYQDPSSYQGSVVIENDSAQTAKVTIPSDAAGKDMHVILEVHDDGAPNLYAYRRVVLTATAATAESPEPEAGSPYVPFPKKVVVTKVKHFDNLCWKIAMAGGTWYFENGETEGKSGFSSAFDQAGNDWIGNDADRGYNKSPNAGGRHEYRGWPNFGEGNFDHPQRKSGTKTRWVDPQGKEIVFDGKLEGDHLIMRSANSKYELEYHFFPSHAAIKVLKAEDKYAFLFEGPIGGEQEASVEKDYYVLKDGKHRECKTGPLGYLDPEFGNKFPSPFFYLADSDPKDTQVFYVGVKNTGPETAGDEGWRQGRNMVIFSYGRDEDKRAYTGTDAVCVFGFHEKADHEAISKFIEARLANPFSGLDSE